MRNILIGSLAALLCSATLTQGKPAQSSRPPVVSLHSSQLLAVCAPWVREFDGARVSPYHSALASTCLDYIELIGTATHARRAGWPCMPKEVQLGQVVRLVVKFLQETPEMLHESMLVSYVKAINNAFPCQQTAR